MGTIDMEFKELVAVESGDGEAIDFDCAHERPIYYQDTDDFVILKGFLSADGFSAPVPQHFWKSLAIHDISARKSASSPCCIPGTKRSSFILMSIASFPPVACRSITPAGLNHVIGSFFPSKCSVAFSVGNSLPICSRPFNKANSTSMEI